MINNHLPRIKQKRRLRSTTCTTQNLKTNRRLCAGKQPQVENVESQADQGEAHGWRQVFKKKGTGSFSSSGEMREPLHNTTLPPKRRALGSYFNPRRNLGSLQLGRKPIFRCSPCPFGQCPRHHSHTGFTSSAWQW